MADTCDVQPVAGFCASSVPFLRDLSLRLEVSPNEAVLLLLIFACVVVVGAVAIWDISRPKKSRTVVLLGLSGAGKTSLFLQLRDGSLHGGTVTSQELNQGTFPFHSELAKNPKSRPVHVVDVPGHSRLRTLLDPCLQKAAAVVYLVDALDFMPHIKDNAQYLYQVLTHPVVRRRKVPVLIAANKTDKVTAHSVEFVRKQLEKEIDKLRSSQKASLSLSEGHSPVLGVTGELFKFEQCSNVTPLVECSVIQDKIADIVYFIRSHVRQ